MIDIERRALLGDRKAQYECAHQGIILPCPICGSQSEISLRRYNGKLLYRVSCMRLACPLYGTKSKYFQPIYALEDWNRRQAPPIGRCNECANRYVGDSDICFSGSDDDFCSGFKPKGGEENG